MSRKKEFKVADLFCGAGGTSTGAQKAIEELGGHMDLVALNHWNLAIETHKLNHPDARHYVEDVTVADPNKLVPEGYLDLLMASPECTFYSRARGGKPVFDQGRMNPWAVLRWLTQLHVRCLLVENVPEFVHWGPLLADGRPDPDHKGEYFQAWFFAIQKAGYHAEWRMLNAADYGEATTRTRFFLIARKDERPVRWPEATHSADGAPDMVSTRPRWRAAREIIEWADPGRSLLDDPRYLKKPLSEKTMKRIARGLEKFGGPLAPYYVRLLGLETDTEGGTPTPESFVMGKQSGNPALRSMKQPIPTITAQGKPIIVNPTIEPFMMSKESSPTYRAVDGPVPGLATRGSVNFVHPSLVKYYGTAFAAEIDAPVPTLTTKGRFGLVNPSAEPFISPFYGIDTKRKPRAHDLKDPLRTQGTSNRFGLVVPTTFMLGQHSGGAPRDVAKPIPTVCADGATALVQSFLVPQFGEAPGQEPRAHDIDEPAPSVTSHGAGALVSPFLVEATIEKAGESEVDPRRLVLIDGQPFILDIRFRMLNNLELARAMGFTDDESTYEFCGNKGEVTRQIGNAVPVHLAKALVKEILAE